MVKKELSDGVVHATSRDMRKAITAQAAIRELWEDITPLARNEWICWVISAKQQETRDRRIRIMTENLLAGKRRPCCWAGCPHRSGGLRST